MSDKKLTRLTLNFENVCSMDIPMEIIKSFHFNDIKESITYDNTYNRSNFRIKKSCNIFILELNCKDKDPDIRKTKVYWNREKTIFEINDIFERLEKRDIVSFTLVFSDNTEEEYYVLWDEESDNYNFNEYQSIEFVKNHINYDKDNLILRICK